MLNKRTLLASSALAVLAGASQADARDFYFSFFGGANFLLENGPHTTSSCCQRTMHNLDADTGFLLGAEIGVHLDNWLHGLRTGLEASYRRNHIGGNWSAVSIIDGPTFGKIEAHQSTFAIMANVWYDIPLGYKWMPYIGGGAGWARTRVSGGLTTTATSGGGNRIGTAFAAENSGFAFQLGAGVNYEIQDGVSLGLGYRYFRGPQIKNDIFFGKNDVINFRNENHSVMIDLTVDVN